MFKSLLFFLSAVTFAASQTNVAAPALSETTQSTVMDTQGARWFTALELRPSYGSKVGEWHTMDTVEGGYYFNKNTRLYYSQWFTSNLYNPEEKSAGLGTKGDLGALRFRKENFLTTGNTAFSYRGWLFTPTSPSAQEAGMITRFRNDFKVTQTLNNSLSMDLIVSPMMHFYKTAGVGDSVNPALSHRFTWNTDWKVSEKVLISLPVWYEATRYRAHQDGVAMNNTWGHAMYAWPELDYTINDTHMVGVAFLSENMMNATDASLNIGDGLEKGQYQLIWGISL